MSFEILVALKITDEVMYQDYRAAMEPILVHYGGLFCYDFKVSDVLKAQKNEDVNRIFTLNFPSKEKKDSFFSDEAYQVVKAQYFENSVAQVHILAAYEKA